MTTEQKKIPKSPADHREIADMAFKSVYSDKLPTVEQNDCRDCIHISGASRVIVCTVPIPSWAEGYRIIKDASVATNCDCYERRKDKT